jgi:CBS domain-containing protein
MSARAAWRLEGLGFAETYRYTAGKADWLANGLPTEGTQAQVPRVGDLTRRDVPTCRLSDRVGDVRERVRAAGWDLCVVVNERNVVLGRLRDKELAADPAASVEQVMEEGPTTYRLDRPAAETARYLAKRRVTGVLITTSDGELIGLFRRGDVDRGGEDPGADGA